VTLPEQPPESRKPAISKERRRTRAHAGATLHEGNDLVIALDADDARCAIEARSLQMAKEGMDRCGPPALPAADGVANPHRVCERAAHQWHLAGHAPHPSGGTHGERSHASGEDPAMRLASETVDLPWAQE